MIPPCPADFNLAEYVLGKSAETPDKLALVILRASGAERFSYARLNAAVLGMSGALSEMAKPGALVFLRIGNTPDFPIAFLGAIAAGCVPVPISQALTASEVAALASRLAPDLVLADPELALPDLPCPVRTDLAAMAAQGPGGFQRGHPDRLAYVMFTSGSSGVPRAVAHAHRAVWARRMMWQGWYGLTPEDRLCHAGAFNWSFTLGAGLLDPWAVGATALIPAPGTGPAQLPLLIRRHDVSIFAAVPGIYRKMLRSVSQPFPKLRHGLSAGERLSPALRRQWQAATGTDLHEALGMSECSTFISGAPDRPAPEGTAGYPQDGRRIAVLDDAGQPAPTGTPGQLAIHRSDPGLMLGYLDGDTPLLPLKDDWFLTGDQVQQDAEGAITHLGRRDDLMNAGGFRVAPQEVEAAFAGAEGLVDCAAFSFEIKPGTHVIALAHEGSAQEQDLRRMAGHGLAAYKQPRLYAPVEALPRSANGKLMRKALPALIRNAADDPT